MTPVADDNTECSRNRATPHHDAGFTLVEIVIAIVLMAVLVVPVLSAVSASIEASSRTRMSAQVETMVVNVADRVNRAPDTLCDYTSYAKAAALTQKWEANQVDVKQYYYVPSDNLNTAGSWQGDGSSACQKDERAPLELSLVRITITSPDGKVTRTVEVVKSDV